MQTHVKLRNNVFPFMLDLVIFPVWVHSPCDNDEPFRGRHRRRHLIPGKRGRRQQRREDRLIVGEGWEGVKGLIFLQESHLPGVPAAYGKISSEPVHCSSNAFTKNHCDPNREQVISP